MILQPVYAIKLLAISLLLVCVSGKAFSGIPTDANALDFLEIKEYASFSNESYKSQLTIEKNSISNGYELTHYSSITEIEIAYFLLTNEIKKTQLIVVRGTSNVENAMLDVDIKMSVDKIANVRIHNGFSRSALAIYNEIKPRIKSGYTINTTGHSLGGAVALILAMYLDVDNQQIGKVITFGQPKVTNIAGANKYQHLTVIRVVTPKDLVPLVPPFDPMDYNNIDIYWHLGKEILLLSENTYATLEGLKSMIRATQFTQQTLDESNIVNHQMSTYLNMLDTKIPVAKAVPFKSSLNLFNLFGG